MLSCPIYPDLCQVQENKKWIRHKGTVKQALKLFQGRVLIHEIKTGCCEHIPKPHRGHEGCLWRKWFLKQILKKKTRQKLKVAFLGGRGHRYRMTLVLCRELWGVLNGWSMMAKMPKSEDAQPILLCASINQQIGNVWTYVYGCTFY